LNTKCSVIFQDNYINQGLPAAVREDREIRRVDSTFHRQKRSPTKSTDGDDNVVVLEDNPFPNLVPML
jgi:hypothetical protein